MERKKKVWPNYYQLALMLGCDSLDGTQKVKNKILTYLKDNPELKNTDYFKHTVAAVSEIETRFKNNMSFDVDVNNIDVRRLNKRDMDSIVKFGVNVHYILECLWNPNFYTHCEELPTRNMLLAIK